MAAKDIFEVCEKVQQYLDKEHIYADVYPYGHDMPVFQVEIHWGDWKHEHARARWLLQDMGALWVGSDVTEENGSDCYSAVHRFIDGTIGEMLSAVC